MKRFSFKLDVLLELRTRAEEKVKQRLGQVFSNIQVVEREIHDCSQSLQSMQREQLCRQQEGADITTLRHTVAWRHHLKVQLLGAGRRLDTLRQEAEQVRIELVAATQQRKAVELIRERAFEAWKKVRNRQEQKNLDDITQQQYIRQKSGMEHAHS